VLFALGEYENENLESDMQLRFFIAPNGVYSVMKSPLYRCAIQTKFRLFHETIINYLIV